MIKRHLRALYIKIFAEDTRKWIFKLRNPGHYRKLRQVVNPSPKGDFSLRAFDQNKCIFIHITKSAGTSVAKALFGELPFHYTAMDYRVIYGRKTFDRYFKFAFVRNPWDRLYSAFSYLKGGGWNDEDAQWALQNLEKYTGFRDFVLNGLRIETTTAHLHFRKQVDFLTNPEGDFLIDHLAYFETIADDFDDICDRIGKNASLEHTNRSLRRSYRDVYDEEMIAKVGMVYAEDIQAFGYQFEGIARRKRVLAGQLVDL